MENYKKLKQKLIEAANKLQHLNKLDIFINFLLSVMLVNYLSLDQVIDLLKADDEEVYLEILDLILSKFLDKLFVDKNFSNMFIEINTKEEADSYAQLLEYHGYVYNNGVKPTEIDYFSIYGENLVFRAAVRFIKKE